MVVMKDQYVGERMTVYVVQTCDEGDEFWWDHETHEDSSYAEEVARAVFGTCDHVRVVERVVRILTETVVMEEHTPKDEEVPCPESP